MASGGTAKTYLDYPNPWEVHLVKEDEVSTRICSVLLITYRRPLLRLSVIVSLICCITIMIFFQCQSLMWVARIC